MERRIIKRCFRHIALFAVFALVAGCAVPMRFSSLQDQYNAAAETEITQREANQIPQDAQAALRGGGYYAPRGKYLEALKTADDLISKNAGQLSIDRLLGSAYTIKALSHWKVGQYAEAQRSATLALGEFSRYEQAGEAAFVREKAVMTALPGLIKLDTCFRAMREQSFASREDLEGSIYRVDDKGRTYHVAAALTILEDAKSQASEGHPVRDYLLFAQLAGIKTWFDALAKVDRAGKAAFQTDREKGKALVDFYTKYKKETFDPVKTKYLKMLEGRFPRNEQGKHPAYARWEYLLQ